MSGDYISRESVLALAKDICVLTKWDSEYRHRSIDPQDVRELPAADVVPVVRGKWERTSRSLMACSVCGNCVVDDRISGLFYCPNCGADME